MNGIPSNAYVKSIRLGGEDVLRNGIHIARSVDNPLQIVLGIDGGTISGSVVDEKLSPFANATVALVPELADLRRRPDLYRNTVTDAAGNFELKTIPPGSYKLFAWDWAETDAWQNANFITAYESLGKSILVSASSKQDRIQSQPDRDWKGGEMMRRATLIILLFLCVVHGRALSQQPTAYLQGIVVEEGGGTPIAKANVELRAASGSGQAIANTQTDREGKFYLPNVTAGPYRVVVTHAGHVNAEYGQRYPGGAPSMLMLAPGQRAMDLRIAMTRAGVISGHITDKGQPIGQADAFAMRAVYTEGQLSLTPVLSIRTDDLGEYHLFWLPPGRYYIVGAVWDFAGSVPRYVNAEGTNTNSFVDQRYIGRAVFLRATAGGVLADNEAHIPIFYPGTPDPKLATVIDVKPGADLRGVDIDASAVITPRVRGRVVGLPAPVTGPAGQPSRVNVSMRPISPTVTTSSAQTPSVSADSTGNFEITNAAPGRYMLTATADNLSGRVLVEVRDRDVG